MTENRMVPLSGTGLRDILRVIYVEVALRLGTAAAAPLGGHTGAVTSEAADREPDRISKIRARCYLRLDERNNIYYGFI